MNPNSKHKKKNHFKIFLILEWFLNKQFSNMYKTQFILLALLIGPLSLCQNALVKVTYYFEVNKGTGPLVTEGQLYLNENFSDFVYPDFNRTRPIKAEDFGLPPGTPITVLDSGKKNNATPVIFRLFNVSSI